MRAREQGIEALRAGREAAEDDDAEAYDQAQAELRESQQERLRLAREIGFYECSRPLDEPDPRAESEIGPQPGQSS